MTRASVSAYPTPPAVLRPGFLPVVATLVFSVATFLLLPLMGELSRKRHESVDWRSAPEVVPPPPIEVERPRVVEDAESQVKPRPKLKKPVRPVRKKRRVDRLKTRLSLSMRPMAVNAGDFGLDFEIRPEASGEEEGEAEPEPPPPAEVVREPSIYEMGQLDRRPTRIRGGRPIYPARAKRNNIEGFVELVFRILPDGRVSNIRIVRADPPNVFEQAAHRAVSAWRFSSPMKGGRRVTVRVRQRIRFKLRDR